MENSVQPNILNLQLINQYLIKVYNNSITSFKVENFSLEEDDIPNHIINKMEEIRNYLSKQSHSLSIIEVNKYLKTNFQGKVEPIDVDELEIDNPNSEVKLINKMEDIREYQHKEDVDYFN